MISGPVLFKALWQLLGLAIFAYCAWWGLGRAQLADPMGKIMTIIVVVLILLGLYYVLSPVFGFPQFIH